MQTDTQPQAGGEAAHVCMEGRWNVVSNLGTPHRPYCIGRGPEEQMIRRSRLLHFLQRAWWCLRGNESTARHQPAAIFELVILRCLFALFPEQLPASIPGIHHVVRRADAHYCGAEGRWVAELCQPPNSELNVCQAPTSPRDAGR